MTKLLAGPSNSITNPILNNTFQGLIGSPSGGSSFLALFIPRLIGISFILGAVIFFFMLIAGAIQWISSGGDKGAIESARGRVINAIIGIIILFSVYAVIRLVEAFFGISILTLDIGSLVIQ